MKSFDALAKNFMRVAYSVNHEGGKSVLMMEASWGVGRKTLKFVKHVPMICVNLIVIVNVVPEKRKGITFVQCSCTI